MNSDPRKIQQHEEPHFSTLRNMTQVDLNTATVAQLLALPGVGETIATRIVAARPFTSVRELRRIPWIGDKRFAALTPLVVVGGAAGPAADSATEFTASAGPAAHRRAHTPEVARTPLRDITHAANRRGNGRLARPTVMCETGNNRRRSDENEAPALLTPPVLSRVVADASVRSCLGQGHSVATDASDALLVASWNIPGLSREKDASQLSRIAEVVNEFDLVAVQVSGCPEWFLAAEPYSASLTNPAAGSARHGCAQGPRGSASGLGLCRLARYQCTQLGT